MFLRHIQKCRLCGNPHLEDVIDLGVMPSQGFFIYKNKPAPPDRKIPTKIIRCNSQKWENACGLVQNSVIVPPEILYSNYGYASSVSNTMVNWLKTLHEKVVEIKGDLTGKLVCDMGMNDGTFLRNYGLTVKKIGIDPSDIAKAVNSDIKVINECFPTSKLECFLEESGCQKIDVFTAWACFYDVLDIKKTLERIRDVLADDGIFGFEVAYLPTVLKDLLFDGMVHEHVSLFSFATLEWVLKNAGLKVISAEKTKTNSGSLLVFACHETCDKFNIKTEELQELRLEEFSLKLDEPEIYEDFKNRVVKHSGELKGLLIKLKSENKKIHILGASTKLNTILYFNNIGPELIDCAAERDSRKWGGQLMNGIPIVSEEESRQSVEIYLVGPVHFKQEILEREKDLRRRGVHFLFPLPQIELIN